MDLPKVSRLFYIAVCILSFSCDRYKQYDQYQDLKGGNWKQNEPVLFNVKVEDTISPVHVFLNVRTDKEYGYRNLFVISKVTLPSTKVIQDTLEYEITDAFGNWLGQGWTDVRNNKLFFLENYQFPEKGMYQFQFYQAMRKRGSIEGFDELLGVTDVGLRIEKTQNKDE